MAVGTMVRLIDLPRQAVVLAGDETRLNLLPRVGRRDAADLCATAIPRAAS